MTFAISDIGDHASLLDNLLRLNNENARETSLLRREKLASMIAAARVATAIEPGIAFLLAFAQDDNFDGGHFRWFRERLDNFLYVDRIVVGHGHRRRGLGRLLYQDLVRRAELLGHSHIACEINVRPPNPTSDAFHASLGFTEIGTATIDDGQRRSGISCVANSLHRDRPPSHREALCGTHSVRGLSCPLYPLHTTFSQ